ncbi:MAG: FKBP-type peptidyl-prolyl cis-trans isomerase [Saprospiraceae bacterium]|nr:FKBP-type peptidyl-prolyl cis-trans isomerase [Saprospiraceae bacterium]
MYKNVFYGLCVLLFVACQQEEEKEIMGYKYEHPVQTDAVKPQPGEYVLYHYYLRDDKGEILEASKTRQPFSTFRIPPADAYPKKAALIELMKIMSVGDSARLYYPIDSLPEGGRDRFGDTKQLVYELVIQDVQNDQEFAATKNEMQQEQSEQAEAAKGQETAAAATVQQALNDYKSGNLGDQLQEINGVEYVIHQEGSGDKVQDGDNITAHYYGVLKEDGSMFDNSFSRGQPFTFKVGQGQVIQGWDQGFKALSPGAKATLFIPYNMAYGEQGRGGIPAKADLVFYVELLEVN